MGKKDQKKKSRKRSHSNGEGGYSQHASSSTAPTGSSSSLMDSIFGSSSAAPVVSCSLFSSSTPVTTTILSTKRSAATLEQKPPMKKVKKRKDDTDTPSAAATADVPSIILQRRRFQSQHLLLQRALDFPGVFRQEISGDSIDLPKEEQAVEMAQAVRQHGLVVVRHCIDRKILQNQIVPWTKALQKNLCHALQRRGIEWRPNNATNNTTTTTNTFRFQEAASRCPGRMDVAVAGGVVKSSSTTTTSSSPFNDDAHIHQELLQNATVLPVIHNLLGHHSDSQVQLVYAGLIFNVPGSSNQPWHQDGVPLFGESRNSTQIQASLPPYALNVFIPLETADGAPERGPTEFWPGSHQWLDDEQQLQQVNTAKDNNNNVIGPILRQGDVLIYDYRVCHRGTANLTTTTCNDDKALQTNTRKILYLMYARPWFTDHVNFDYTTSAESIWDDTQSTTNTTYQVKE